MPGDLFVYTKAHGGRILLHASSAFVANRDIISANVMRGDGSIEVWLPGNAPPAEPAVDGLVYEKVNGAQVVLRPAADGPAIVDQDVARVEAQYAAGSNEIWSGNVPVPPPVPPTPPVVPPSPPVVPPSPPVIPPSPPVVPPSPPVVPPSPPVVPPSPPVVPPSPPVVPPSPPVVPPSPPVVPPSPPVVGSSPPPVTSQITVSPGESWVAAVRKAKPGQTVKLAAGVWTEGLTDGSIRAIGVRIVGAGMDQTIIRPSNGRAINAWRWEDCSIEDLSVVADTTTDDGITLRGCRNITLLRVHVERFRFNVSAQSAENATYKWTCENIEINSCRIFDSTPIKDAAGAWRDSSNLYCDEIAGLKVIKTFFDRAGRGPADAEVTIPVENAQRNHNFYCKPSCTNVEITDNVFRNACSHGLQARAGGNVSSNWFIDNPIHLSFGLVNGEGPICVGGASGVIQGNLFLGTRLLADKPRGYAVEISNTKDVEIRENIFAGDHAAPQGGLVVAAVKLDVCLLKDTNPAKGTEITVTRAVFAGNACTWPNGLLWRNPKIPQANVTMQTDIPPVDVAAKRTSVVGARTMR